jgi:glycosyltransferase involved in cell wall biosynthesis
MTEPALSVVIPTYNRASFLPPCVASLRNCGLPVQIIIVDDGSTDNTAEVVKNLPGVTYIAQVNAGVAAARNRGLELSQTRYVAFLDSDDTWSPGVAERLIEALDQCPHADVAFADTYVHDMSIQSMSRLSETRGRSLIRAIAGEVIANNVRLLDRAAFFRCMVDRNQVFLGSAIIRRDAARLIGGFDNDLNGAADFEFMLRLAHRGPFLYLDEPLAHYFKHENNMSSDLSHMDRDFALVFLKIMEKCSLSEAERNMVRSQRQQMLRYLMYNSFNQGASVETRAWCRELWREFGADVNSWAVFTVSHLPRQLISGLRRVRRTLMRML